MYPNSDSKTNIIYVLSFLKKNMEKNPVPDSDNVFPTNINVHNLAHSRQLVCGSVSEPRIKRILLILSEPHHNAQRLWGVPLK